ncbi:MAG TPA: cadherin repeat domain-containing protein, partial [Helicobacteraceae bacterium]|nr:cadherin repeat domain-containing protein [Helicobacteraceae bacterium]
MIKTYLTTTLVLLTLFINSGCNGSSNSDTSGNSQDTTAPVFTSSATVSVNENQTELFTLEASDATTLSYSISGTDASDLSVNSSSGVVTFNEAPDFETK